MKKNLIIAFLLVISKLMYAQDYQISFIGSGLSSTVDSIEVLNLTQQTSLTLIGSDILNLSGNVGFSEVSIRDEKLKVFPNPMNLTAGIEFENPSLSLTTIYVIDNAGRIVLRYAESLVKGYHAFAVSGLQTGSYLIHISTDEVNYSAQLISTGSKNRMPYLTYFGNNSISETKNQLKISRNLVHMQYNNGDLLLLKGFSSDYERIITIVPTESQQIEFEFVECVDIDNNFYPVVTIGTQTWMAENLKVSHYSNGDEIPNITDGSQWGNFNSGAYCWYNNDISWIDAYGALYNWYSVVDSRGLCPSGWHSPTDAEWSILTNYLGGESVAGGKMKSTRTAPDVHPRWDSPNTGATNESGFSSLPGGYRRSNGEFFDLGRGESLWSSTEVGSDYAWYRYLLNFSSNITTDFIYKPYGFSVRCLRD